MRKVKNITVCVTPEIYRQTRHLAAEYDSTVSTIVAWLLERLPAALERTHFPKGGPKPSAQPTPPIGGLVIPPTPNRRIPGSEAEPDAATPPPDRYSPIRALKIMETIIANSACETVTPSLTSDISAACTGSACQLTAPVKLYDSSQPKHK
jgi:hypothetical protein